jgi:hypothetical protein
MDYGPAGMKETVTSIAFDADCGWQFNYFDKRSIKVIGNIFSYSNFIKPYKPKMII